jgi:cell division inhibitor SepF
MATMWKKTLSFLGLVEEYDDEYADLPPEEEPAARPTEPPARAEQSNVRRIAPTPSPARMNEPAPTRDIGRSAPPGRDERPNGQHVGAPSVHVTNPTTFNDVEEVGEQFRGGIPVIMNLAGASESVAKRMLDFASGLIFGLDGRIERVGDRVFLLTPAGLHVSTEERRRLSERGFFNQA